MTDSEKSKQVVREYQEAMGRGDRAAVRNILAPDVKIWVAAAPPKYGALLTLDDYFVLVDTLHKLRTENPPTRVSPMVAEGEHVYMQAETRIPISNGRIYNNQYVFYYRVREGKITVLKEYHDTLHFVDVFQGTPFFEENTQFLGAAPNRQGNMFDVESA
jgi:ketosteroid isomerase-like protein